MIPTEILSIFVTAAGATALAAALGKIIGPLNGERRERRNKRISLIKDQISKKLSGKIAITAKDVADIGRGLDASPSLATEALYQLFAESDNETSHSELRKLIDDLTREDPFESLPEVARPSLARITTLCSTSPQTTDKELLHPITKLLEEYQEMKRDHSAIKRQNKISYVVALVSFFIGVVGLILAFTGPSKSYISSEINTATTKIVETLKEQQKSVR